VVATAALAVAAAAMEEATVIRTGKPSISSLIRIIIIFSEVCDFEISMLLGSCHPHLMLWLGDVH
jgi:hypothetical protein